MSETLAPNWLVKPNDVNAVDSTLWPASFTRDVEGQISVGGVAVGDLAAEFGTPLYVLDKDDFFARAKLIKTAFEGSPSW